MSLPSFKNRISSHSLSTESKMWDDMMMHVPEYGLSAQCVRLRSEINPTRAGHAPDGSSPYGLPPYAHVAGM